MKKAMVLSKAEMRNVMGGKKQAICSVCDGTLVAEGCMQGLLVRTDANGLPIGGNWSATNGGCADGPQYVMYGCMGSMVEQPC